jgi:hypothetical protein
VSVLVMCSDLKDVKREVPETFLIAEFGDKDKAQARWEKTLQWRKDNDVDDTLNVREHYAFLDP